MQKGTNLTIVSTTLLAPVVQKVDNTIHRINLNPLDSATGFPNTYPVDSAIHLLNNLGLIGLNIKFLRNLCKAAHTLYINPWFSNQLLHNKISSESN